MKIYSVWASSNREGWGDQHCGYIRANGEEEAASIGKSVLSVTNETEFDYFYANEWIPAYEGCPEPICSND
jgi:hypothetical protein